MRITLRFVAVTLLLAACETSASQSGGPSGSPPLGTLSAATPTATTSRLAPAVVNRALAEEARIFGRGDVAICLHVDPSTGVDSRAALASLQGTIDGLVGQGYTVLGARSAAPCPEGPLFIRTGTVHPKNSGNGPIAAVPQVTTASPFQLHVALTTPARITRIFGGLASRRGSEEVWCSGHNCAEATGSIYVDATTFASGAERERLLFEGLGLLGR